MVEGERRTCDVLVQDGVLVEDVVDQPLAVTIENEHFPLSIVRRGVVGAEEECKYTSPRVMVRMVPRRTARRSAVRMEKEDSGLTLALGLDDGHHPAAEQAGRSWRWWRSKWSSSSFMLECECSPARRQRRGTRPRTSSSCFGLAQ